MTLLGIANGILIDIDGVGKNALLGKPLGVASSDHAKTYN